VVDAAVPDGVTVAGAKLHVAPTGRPEQVNETAESNPFTGVTVIVAVPAAPEVTVSDAGEAATVKSGTDALVVVALTWFEAGEVPFELVASTT